MSMEDNQQPSSGVRACAKCGKEKQLTEFPKYTYYCNGEKLRGHRRDCLDCRRAYQAAWARGEVVPVKEGDTRVCRSCGGIKPHDQFAKVYCQKNRGTQYRSHTCLMCHRAKCAAKEKKRRAEKGDSVRAIRRAHYHRNPERAAELKKRSHQKLKDEVFANYGGYVCRCCGETESGMLNIDHIDENGAEHRRALGLTMRNLINRTPKLPGGATFYHWLKTQGFPPGYQVLCYNCNISKHRNGGFCAHQHRRGLGAASDSRCSEQDFAIRE